jgi:hypothetical protein
LRAAEGRAAVWHSHACMHARQGKKYHSIECTRTRSPETPIHHRCNPTATCKLSQLLLAAYGRWGICRSGVRRDEPSINAESDQHLSSTRVRFFLTLTQRHAFNHHHRHHHHRHGLTTSQPSHGTCWRAVVDGRRSQQLNSCSAAAPVGGDPQLHSDGRQPLCFFGACR